MRPTIRRSAAAAAKKSGSKKTATTKKKETSQMKSSKPQEYKCEIRNLPEDENFKLTSEILKMNVCRICATYYESESSVVSLYIPYETLTMSNVVNFLLPIKVNQDDGLPEVACKPCVERLIMWNDMLSNCIGNERLLSIQAQQLQNRDSDFTERSQLCEIVQNILASYSLNVEWEMVCQECSVRTTSEAFVQHMQTRHAAVRGREAVEEFVREHVTFEEVLRSDLESDGGSIGSDAPQCEGVECAGLSPSRYLEHSEGSLRDGNGNLRSGDLGESKVGISKKGPDHGHSLRCNVGRSGLSASAPETNQKRIPAVCPHCNRTFSNKYNMFAHMKRHTEGRVEFRCECGAGYSTRGNLAAHRRAAHAARRPHRCAPCGAAFATRAARDVHARRHAGVRPYRCGRCGAAFRDRGTRARHADTHAPRRFPCALCGAAFRRPAHLRYHVTTHRG